MNGMLAATSPFSFLWGAIGYSCTLGGLVQQKPGGGIGFPPLYPPPVAGPPTPFPTPLPLPLPGSSPQRSPKPRLNNQKRIPSLRRPSEYWDFGPGLYYYGNYCGSANVKPPGMGFLPVDCVDACCMIHDRCLEGHYHMGYDENCAHLCCDCALADCVERALGSDCCDEPRSEDRTVQPDPDWWPSPYCRGAAASVSTMMNILCAFYSRYTNSCPNCLDDPGKYAWGYWYSVPGKIEPVPCELT